MASRCSHRARTGQEFADFYAKARAGGTLFEQTGSVPSQVTARAWNWCAAGRSATRAGGAAARDRRSCVIALDGHAASRRLSHHDRAGEHRGRAQERVLQDARGFRLRARGRAEGRVRDDRRGRLPVQIDDAWLAALWDRIGIQMGLEAYKRYCMMRVEALNHALQNVPEEQIRYHLCWGSWHGPHALRHPDGRHRRRHARGQGADVSVRGRERAARARVHALGAREAAGGTRSWRPASSRTRRR